MNIRTIKLCPLYETCPQTQCRDAERVYADNVEYIQIIPHPCLRRKPGQRKKYLCMMQIDLDKITLEKALDDILKHRKNYTKYYYASEVDDYINKIKEMINDGWSSRES